MSEPVIRILIADDHGVVRAGMHFLISTEPDIEIIGEAVDGNEAVQKALQLKPDVVLLDLKMPHKGGLAAIGEIVHAWPKARILVITSFTDDKFVFPAIKAGALGYLLKDSSPQELIQAIRDVYAGESPLHPKIARKLIREIKQPPDLPPTEQPLTDRELEVLKLVAQGLANQEIADCLVVGERTVRAHVSAILSKLHLANRTQAALYALRQGIADLQDETST